MGNAYTRSKQPELVRRALLDHAAKLAVEQGLAAVTVQAVSDAAGVTKGGFTHHFPSKQALIDTVFHELLEKLGHDLDRRMEGARNAMALSPAPILKPCAIWTRVRGQPLGCTIDLDADGPEAAEAMGALVPGSARQS
jgi:AcrR family transcriptional regulator